MSEAIHWNCPTFAGDQHAGCIHEIFTRANERKNQPFNRDPRLSCTSKSAGESTQNEY